ncbi:ABC transporter ATP-binding protein [Metasolibacillus meyeri]|uniref:ABC transporter ATP-binding protein n=1 Tax=Metasolibacillus meyeri TaxID=1071052 RepID=A0AAW9NRS9_9BACL|nr:ABC transporter ATP-binding protein [Metasolibacillus meyeri]MEC1178640.1 ABC transporter ATP-binding protein [Metasolibacillus meyeri]
MKNAIIVKNLYRIYSQKKGKFNALKGINFSVKEGEVFGLLGPNGAGKTTTTKILTTLLKPTSGSVNILGFDIDKHKNEIRKQINFVFGGEKGVYGRLTPVQYLIYFSCLYKVPSTIRKKLIFELLELVGLDEHKEREIYTFSKGMLQRLHIARSLINDPKILFLDEPTIGLDPIIAQEVRDIIQNLKRKGTTIILTTHYMKEADELCDTIAIINEGQIKAIDSPENLKNNYFLDKIYECTILLKFENYEIPQFKFLQITTLDNTLMKFRIAVSKELDYLAVKRKLSEIGEIVSLEQTKTSLEDVYIKIIKGEI